MRDRTTLAVSASNLSGGPAFTVALRSRGQIAACDPAGAIGNPILAARGLCDRAGISPRDIGEILVDVGPGSYTGLRVAVTMARFLHSICGARILRVTSFELHAARALERGRSAAVRPIADARRGHLLTALLALERGVLSFAEAPRAVRDPEIRQAVRRGELAIAPARLLPRLRDLLGDEEAGRPLDALAGETFFDERIAPAEVPPEALEPLYLMASYAE